MLTASYHRFSLIDGLGLVGVMNPRSKPKTQSLKFLPKIKHENQIEKPRKR